MSTSAEFKDRVRAVADLESHGADIVRTAEEGRGPVLLTRHGRAVAVVIALDDYEAMRAAIRSLELRCAVEEPDEDVAAGRLVPHNRIMNKYRQRMP